MAAIVDCEGPVVDCRLSIAERKIHRQGRQGAKKKKTESTLRSLPPLRSLRVPTSIRQSAIANPLALLGALGGLFGNRQLAIANPPSPWRFLALLAVKSFGPTCCPQDPSPDGRSERAAP